MGVKSLLSPPPLDLGQLEAWAARFRAVQGSTVSTFLEGQRPIAPRNSNSLQRMNPEVISIASVGVAIIGTLIVFFRWIRRTSVTYGRRWASYARTWVKRSGVPPLISWADKTHHTQAAGFSVRRCLA